ncbi:MAG: HAD-IB family hydrolase [Gammaproteobacteria bacterium]|jgi:putative phosphoserine phosphatase/1-acylglycerol-3-phosphate O-acyltransferase|nr:HAD-IB family hydrolase [Gammaproteobacteria bacterium]MDH3820439.1 HAD-IB family hydrolase [Gammaproteobacteria bacterium]MDH3982841.1 HAD-IB family hydrolase [Gammaproteobacteria bacterium]
MLSHQDVIAEILDLPDGPEIGAFFDFDGTIISGYSAVAFFQEQLKRGHMSPRDVVELISVMASFGIGILGFPALMLAASQFLRGVREDSYAEFGEEVFKSHIARQIYPETRAMVKTHLQKGHTVAIISSATPYQVEPAARDLEIENVLCTYLQVEDGEFTGAVVRPICFGPGKVLAAESLSDKFGADLDKSFFYSDSTDDIELLERVGNPRPLNPSNKLQAISERRGWPVRRFASRGRPTPTDWVRTAMVPATLLGSFVSGLPIWALSGSKRDALNFSMSVFADVASALIGLNLTIKGEHHLWSHRPAVFLFNHQSNVDMVIIARLLRRDISGVGKKEIGDIPLIGRILEFAGVVLIDRKDTEKAIETMGTLVDTMRIEGKSVCMSPEGTRSVTPKLAPFKKGAFHLAIQAGVPIVPIVIQNSSDIMPKGDMIYRPATVEVEVLPPVDTSAWSADTIEEHVASVRNLYLEALGQDRSGDTVKPLRVVRK